MMLEKFFPKTFAESVFAVDYDALAKSGIRYLIFDVDNTLEPYDVAKPSQRVLDLLGGLNDRFGICLLSNNFKKRVELFASEFDEALRPPYAWRSGKPRKKASKAALAMLGDPPASQVAMIGDQLFTDIWLANNAGFLAVLVKPLAQRDEFYVRIKRVPERFVMRSYLKRNLKRNLRSLE